MSFYNEARKQKQRNWGEKGEKVNRKITLTRWVGIFLAGVIGLVFVGPAQGTSVQTFLWDTQAVDSGITTFSFTSGNPRASRATFEVSGGNLVIGLTNTSAFDVMVPEENLTALFFDLDGGASLSPVSAVLGEGAVVYQGSTIITDINGDGSVDADDRDVGGEWAYKMNVPTLPATYAISSVGLDDLIGPQDRFDTTSNLAGPESPDGMQYGILSTGDNPATGNGGILGNTMSRDSVVFTLSGLGPDFDLGAVSNVWFHYGTSFTSPILPPPPAVPEPATMAAFVLVAGALTGYTRRRMKKERG